jgi:lipopolysaccharide transport system ATP-binding protein
MSDTVISVESLSKCYLVGHKSAGQGYERYMALRDVIGQKARNVARNAVNIVRGRQVVLRGQVEEFWALKDVSFEVKRGEVLGIIGRNGAGKSTLLKILSRITEPTGGRVTLHGRVASLLEVGTGFHQELTGRENIYLNGAILGMTRAEMRRKFDEIVAFAEVEKFLDTPVKRYSSGMYVRLAFAVAAHLEPEIMVVDEVLAVGDAEFQAKCLGKMQGVANSEGRTVLFVSHNMAAVQQLCHHALWLDHGRRRKIGSASEVVRAYTGSVRDAERSGNFSRGHLTGDGQVRLLSYKVTDAHGRSDPPPGTKEDVFIYVRIDARNRIAKPAYGISITNERGVLMTCINTVELGVAPAELPAGESTICVRINRTSFLPGYYSASFWVMSPQTHIYAMSEDAIIFEIAQAPIYGTCHIDHRWGVVYSDIEFRATPAGTGTSLVRSYEGTSVPGGLQPLHGVPRCDRTGEGTASP